MRFSLCILLFVLAAGCSDDDYKGASSVGDGGTEDLYGTDGSANVDFTVLPDLTGLPVTDLTVVD